MKVSRAYSFGVSKFFRSVNILGISRTVCYRLDRFSNTFVLSGRLSANRIVTKSKVFDVNCRESVISIVAVVRLLLLAFNVAVLERLVIEQ